MSSRQLKKLRAQEEQRILAQKALLEKEGRTEPDDDADDGSEEDETAVETRPRAKNPFAAFAALEDEEDDGKEGQEDEEEEGNGDGDEQAGAKQAGLDAAPDGSQPRPKPSNGKKKKKTKKKGKGRSGADEAPDGAAAGAAAARTSAPARSGKADTDTAELDEIDRALEELNLRGAGRAGGAAATAPGGGGSTQAKAPRDLVQVRLGDLRVLNELREVFGRETIQAAQADEAEGVPGAPRPERAEDNPNVVMVDLETYLRADPPPPRGMVRINGGGGRVAGVVAKRNPFIQWKDTWPRATSGGLGMRPVTADKAVSRAGVVEYTFVHSAAYEELEDQFFARVLMHNPQAVIQFLKQHPYHISSLITVSRIAKLQDQNASLAADLCERALFSFGRATLSSFRQTLVEGRARLNFRRPENRQFVLAGYYYIRSLMLRGTYRTALAWTKVFLSILPNDEYALMLYAHALAVRAFEARWFVHLCGSGGSGEEEEGEGEFAALRQSPMRQYIRQTLVPAKLQLQDVDGARAVLARGLGELPWLYGALFQALNLDVPRAVWGVQPRDEAEALYTQLYVHVARDIWDVPQAIALLKDVAAAAAPAAAAPAAASLPAAAPVPLGLARFVYLDGTPALMGLVPRALLQAEPNYEFDPLPPAMEENEFSSTSQMQPWIVQRHGGNHAALLAQAGLGLFGGGGGGAGWDPADFALPEGDLREEFDLGADDGSDLDEDADDLEGSEGEGGEGGEGGEDGEGGAGEPDEPWQPPAGGMPGAWFD